MRSWVCEDQDNVARYHWAFVGSLVSFLKRTGSGALRPGRSHRIAVGLDRWMVGSNRVEFVDVGSRKSRISAVEGWRWVWGRRLSRFRVAIGCKHGIGPTGCQIWEEGSRSGCASVSTIKWRSATTDLTAGMMVDGSQSSES